MTTREHLLAATQFDPGAVARLQGPPLPVGTEHAWSMFWKLQKTRGSSSAGSQPITHTEIHSFQRNLRHRLTPLDIELVLEADEALREEMRARVPAAASSPSATSAEQEQ